MNTHSRDGFNPQIGAEVPEADAAEQAIPVVPDGDPDPIDDASVTTPEDADPADAWEQHLTVSGDEDGYDYLDPDGR